jgi:hypothetical protein
VGASPGREPGAWQVLLYDGVRGAHSSTTLKGDEPIRYIDVWTNERDRTLEPHPTAADLEEVFATDEWQR